jgi:hypothetical protein
MFRGRECAVELLRNAHHRAGFLDTFDRLFEDVDLNHVSSNPFRCALFLRALPGRLKKLHDGVDMGWLSFSYMNTRNHNARPEGQHRLWPLLALNFFMADIAVRYWSVCRGISASPWLGERFDRVSHDPRERGWHADPDADRRLDRYH